MKGVIGLVDPNMAYRLNTPTPVLRWRTVVHDDREVPFRVSCWPSASGDGSILASIEYDTNPGVELVDVVITIPIVGKSAPIVSTKEGSHHFDPVCLLFAEV